MTTPRDPDDARFTEALRDAMHAEADSVDPRGDGLMTIRGRISSRSPFMRWSRPLAAVAAVALVVGGVTAGVVALRDSDNDNGALVGPPASETPHPGLSPTPSPSESPAAADGREITVPVYYLHDDGTNIRLYREFHRIQAVGIPSYDAVHEMFRGQADDPDYTSLWPEGSDANAITYHGDLVKLNLNSKALGPFNGGSEAAALSVQQLVWTLTGADPTVKSVQILIDGKRVSDLWGTLDISQPQVRHTPSYEVLGAVWILSPTEGQDLAAGGRGAPVRISGVATVFEATVSIDIVDSKGNVVKKTFATASQGAPGRGTWSKTVLLPPGDYVVKAYESSAQNGHPTHIDTKSFAVV